jgi:hypothetical protein
MEFKLTGPATVTRETPLDDKGTVELEISMPVIVTTQINSNKDILVPDEIYEESKKAPSHTLTKEQRSLRYVACFGFSMFAYNSVTCHCTKRICSARNWNALRDHLLEHMIKQEMWVCDEHPDCVNAGNSMNHFVSCEVDQCDICKTWKTLARKHKEDIKTHPCDGRNKCLLCVATRVAKQINTPWAMNL